MTKGQQFLQDMSVCKASGDIDKLLTQFYHPQAKVVSFFFTLNTFDEMRYHFAQDGPEHTGKTLSMSMDYFTETEDVISYKATIKTEKEVIKPNDAFYLKDGKIYRQISMTIPLPELQAWSLNQFDRQAPEEQFSTPGGQFYMKHVNYIAQGDIDGAIRDDYHSQAQMVTFDYLLKNPEELARNLKKSPKITGQLLGATTHYFADAGDVVMFKASVKTEKFGIIKADDAFIFEDGKIFRHIALTIPPEKTKEWASKEL